MFGLRGTKETTTYPGRANRYIAQVQSMWEETKSGGKPSDYFIRAHWYFRPKDVPKTALSSLPVSRPAAKEIFFSDLVEENDVRSVLGVAAVGTEPKAASAMKENE